MNPFFNRQRITDARYFIGRANEIEQLLSALATHQCRALVGERKLGKSSLLTHIASPAVLAGLGLQAARYVFAYLDLEALTSAERDDFWLEVLEKIAAALPTEEPLRTAVRAAVDAGEARFMTARRLLRRLRTAGYDLVLCLDEFEALARNPRFEPDFYGELRSLAGELGVVIITASKRSLYDLTYQHAGTLSSPFFNIFSELRLGLMTSDEATGLLRTLSALGGRPFCDQEVHFALDLAGPHPFFAQLAGAQLFEGEDCGREHSLELYAEVRRRFAAEAEDHYRYMWNNLTSDEQTALVHAPQLTADADRTLRAKALIRDRGRQPLPFSEGFAEFLARQRPGVEPVTPPGAGADLTGRVLGQYRLLEVLGRGGMAEVYKGYHAALDRYVAVKILLPRQAADAEFAERFQREATAVARLRHPNIVQVYDFGVQTGLTYMVMEFIAGTTLKERIQEARTQNRPIPREEALSILRGLAAALDYAHAHGVVHRDVKPANVMLREETVALGAQPVSAAPADGGGETAAAAHGEPILTDFGVAKILEGVQLTASGMSLGTPDYMSPEQGRGDEVTAQADVYALAVVTFEILTNRLPFAGDTPLAVLLKHIHEQPPSLRSVAPQVPPGLEDVSLRGLAQRPEFRLRGAGELVRALEAAWPPAPAGADPR